MSKNLIISIIIAVFSSFLCAEDAVDLTEPMKQSLVYLEVSAAGWDQFQPWRRSEVRSISAYGCAVGPNQVLAVAGPLADAVSIQARRYGQNEYIPASIKVIDYEMNLCLIELDKTALQSALTPLQFVDKYPKNKELKAYWLSSGGHLTTARATLDRADVQFSGASFVKILNFILSNPSRSTGSGEVYCLASEPIGIACGSSETEVSLIPAESINRFLEQAALPAYKGFGAVGFETADLLDPAVRKFLKMPKEKRDGVYVSTVYKMGSGSTELLAGDVLLSINGNALNPYGRYLDDRYDRIGLEHLIGREPVDRVLKCVVWRNSKEESVDIKVRDIVSSSMMVPFYQFDKHPEYVVVGGFVFQTLTRDYMTMWGDGWQGKVPPHLFQYFREFGFSPTDERKDVVLLSYVLPTEANLGYHQLGRIVVKSLNGKEIGSIRQLVDAMMITPESPFHVVEFELDAPTVVIPKAGLNVTNQQVMQMYGIPELAYIER